MNWLRHSFRNRLILIVVGLLWIAQATTLFVVLETTERNVVAREATELNMGARVLPELRKTHTEQQLATVSALASDFGFREAIATGDEATILSALANHGSRASADLVSLIGIEGEERLSLLHGERTSMPLAFPQLVDEAERLAHLTTTLVTRNALYDVVVVPVLAPRTVGWLLMGFAVDDTYAAQLRTLTGLHVSFVALPENRTQAVVASTLGKVSREHLAEGRMIRAIAGGPAQVALGSEKFLSSRHSLETHSGASFAVLQRSLDVALAPYRSLRTTLLLVFGAVSALCVFAAFYTSASVTRPIAALVDAAREIAQGNYRAQLPAGREDEFGLLASAFEQMRGAVAEREVRIVRQAHFDELTGLPNRVRARQKLRAALTQADDAGQNVCVVMLVLERFTEVYGSFGHAVGDVVAKEIARRLRLQMDPGETVARIDSDKFMIIATDVPAYGLKALAESLADTVTRPINLQAARLTVGATLGIAFYPDHGRRCDVLMQRADIAMHDARASHLTYCQYEAGRDEGYLRRLAIVGEVEQAAAQEQFRLHYQPKVCARTGRISQVEALIRWDHPVYGPLAPDEFISTLEDSGNISVLTEWVLDTAISQCARWQDQGIRLDVCVNLSSLDLTNPRLAAGVMQKLTERSVPPQRLVIELTESTVMRDAGQAHQALRQLRALGIRIAVDDFGTGYSSLAKIKSLALDELKIDKSFVLAVEQNKEDAVIVQAIVDLGHNLGFEVTAEGVENDAARQLLTDFGCDVLQGYYFSRPLPAADLETWLQKNQPDIARADNTIAFRQYQRT